MSFYFLVYQFWPENTKAKAMPFW